VYEGGEIEVFGELGGLGEFLKYASFDNDV
jgi:hypothetical protein